MSLGGSHRQLHSLRLWLGEGLQRQRVIRHTVKDKFKACAVLILPLYRIHIGGITGPMVYVFARFREDVIPKCLR